MRINILLQIISLYPDLKTFLINYNLEKRIVIRYCPEKQEVIDVEKNYTYASFLYEYKHYTECMELCLNIIHSDNPTIDAYVLLAHTYIKLGRPKDARDCLIVVYGLTNNFKYADIIVKLNGANSKDLFGFKKTKNN